LKREYELKMEEMAELKRLEEEAAAKIAEEERLHV
jgi:hypothetical protein